MQALLVLYMVNRLLHPGHIENIFGFGPFRHLIESIRGSLSVQALASTIFGLYTGLVYLTPIAGGLIADRLLGRTRTITIGALLMSAGHFLMAFDFSFLIALTCLLTGVGCFKGNLASQVGALTQPAITAAPTRFRFITSSSMAESSRPRSLPGRLGKKLDGIGDSAPPASAC
jgi:POT family proton-dependent oligopeptide transporter